MRAAYVCADRGVPVYGMKGCSLHIQEVVRAFEKQSIQMEIFATTPGDSPPADFTSIPIHQITCKKTKDRAIRERADELNNDNIIKRLSVQNDFDFIYERYSLWSYAGMEYARRAGIPGILEVNAPLIEEQANYRGLINRDAAHRMAQQCFDAATAIIAVSEGVEEYLQSFPQARNKVQIVPNGVNPSRFPRSDRRPFPEKKGMTLGFIGTLKPWHGVDQLIDAFEVLNTLYSDIHLLIIGDGPESAALRNRTKIAGLDKVVTFTGAVTPDQVPHYLSKMDIGIAPYPLSDAFYFSPLKIYEYMAAELPVVASRIGQITTLIEHELTGLLSGNTDAFIASLKRLLNDRIWATTLGSNARQTVIQKHTWDARVHVWNKYWIFQALERNYINKT